MAWFQPHSLTEERSDVAELVVPPVVQQPCRVGGDPPLGSGQHAPLVDAVARRADGRDERDASAPLDDSVGGLPVLIQLPVPRRVFVRRVQDRSFEEPLLHGVILLQTEASVPLARGAP